MTIVECSYEGVYVLHESVTAMNVWCEWQRVRECGAMLHAVDVTRDDVAVLEALSTSGDGTCVFVVRECKLPSLCCASLLCGAVMARGSAGWYAAGFRRMVRLPLHVASSLAPCVGIVAAAFPSTGVSVWGVLTSLAFIVPRSLRDFPVRMCLSPKSWPCFKFIDASCCCRVTRVSRSS